MSDVSPYLLKPRAMKRLTVTIQMPSDREPRDFHLFEDRAESFAADTRAKGGTAIVKPFTPSPAVLSMFASVALT